MGFVVLFLSMEGDKMPSTYFRIVLLVIGLSVFMFTGFAASADDATIQEI